MTFPTNIPDRNKYILEQVKNNNYEHNWLPIISTYNEHTATFYVSQDALKVDSIRINLTAQYQQLVADELNASLLTTKLANLRHVQAQVQIPPLPRPISSANEIMIQHSQDIDNHINGIDITDKIISNVGKNWMICDKITSSVAANFGWFTNTNNYRGIACYPVEIKGLFVVQPLSTRHDPIGHSDYSQTACFVSGGCIVDNQQMTLTDVLTNSDLAGLANYSGILNKLRQP